MTTLTCIDLKMLNAANKTVEKQGFKMVTIGEYGANDKSEYSLLCTYGDTDETYFVYVNPWNETIQRVVPLKPTEDLDTRTEPHITF